MLIPVSPTGISRHRYLTGYNLAPSTDLRAGDAQDTASLLIVEQDRQEPVPQETCNPHPLLLCLEEPVSFRLAPQIASPKVAQCSTSTRMVEPLLPSSYRAKVVGDVSSDRYKSVDVGFVTRVLRIGDL